MRGVAVVEISHDVQHSILSDNKHIIYFCLVHWLWLCVSVRLWFSDKDFYGNSAEMGMNECGAKTRKNFHAISVY